MNERLLTKPGDWELEKHTVKEVPLDFDVINPTMKFRGFGFLSRFLLVATAYILVFSQGQFYNLFTVLMMALMLWGFSLSSIAMNVESDTYNSSQYDDEDDDEELSDMDQYSPYNEDANYNGGSNW